jgi:hypothetical protein
MEAAYVCREMGWTLDEYLDSPDYFLETVKTMLIAESEAKARRERELNKPQ